MEETTAYYNISKQLGIEPSAKVLNSLMRLYTEVSARGCRPVYWLPKFVEEIFLRNFCCDGFTPRAVAHDSSRTNPNPNPDSKNPNPNP